MQLIEIPIRNDRTKPIIELYGMDALIDSGAENIIFNMPLNTASKVFSLKHLKDESVFGLTGYGKAEICRLSHFQISDYELVNIPIALLKNPMPKIPPIIIGSGVFGPDAKKEEDYEDNMIRIKIQEKAILAKKTWIRRSSGEWRILDYKNGKWVALPSEMCISD